ncbi:hypothetical protein EXU85_18225 [Spirosoma sp. KCTC 42546]|uniref:hypothetical protein n=1 Tax=Spirosoma sp. KCTC 42546 TaxID=2520506 RepID=UPI001157C05B|nr:hypothetical protein [Spirosoma sp. KCTC 42546]QDK80436.1 hypothetical protein EXU85_18225 [Spirosoma sp. KCTC 42546]
MSRQARLGVLMLGIIIAIMSTLVYFYLIPKPKLIIKAPTADTCFTDQPIIISWDYRGYKGKVDLFFIDDSTNEVLKKMGSKENNSQGDTQFEWKASDFKSLENKTGKIKIIGGVTEISENKFLIFTKKIQKPITKEALYLLSTFENDGKKFKITAFDESAIQPISGGIVYLNETPIGVVGESINTTSINVRATSKNQKTCDGKKEDGNDCQRIESFTTFIGNEINVRVKGYKISKTIPIETFLNSPLNDDCKCSTVENKYNLKITLKNITNYHLEVLNSVPVPEIVQEKIDRKVPEKVLRMNNNFEVNKFNREIIKSGRVMPHIVE